ncbi:hypothetical protein [Streptomyces sp. NPDC126499]|uniref:hypothetical protein n=1 Tax=Streptomyces sp. NPDC126499 TaxID=3155314 RepID=UPI003321071F
MSIDTLETPDTRETAEHEHVRTGGPVVARTGEHQVVPPCAQHVSPARGHDAPAEDTSALGAGTDTGPGPGHGPGRALVRPALLAGEEHEAPDPCVFRGTD